MRRKPQPVHCPPPFRRTLYGRAARPDESGVRSPARLQLPVPAHWQQLQPSGRDHQHPLFVGIHTPSDRRAGAADVRGWDTSFIGTVSGQSRNCAGAIVENRTV